MVSYGRSGHFSNWVLESEFIENKFENIFRRANEFFLNLNTKYNWLLKQKNFNGWLENKLIKNNFKLLEEIDCMAFDLSLYNIRNNINFKIKKVKTKEELIKALKIDDSYENFSENEFLMSVERNFENLNNNYLWLIAETNDIDVGMTSLKFFEEKTIHIFFWSNYNRKI